MHHLTVLPVGAYRKVTARVQFTCNPLTLARTPLSRSVRRGRFGHRHLGSCIAGIPTPGVDRGLKEPVDWAPARPAVYELCRKLDSTPESIRLFCVARPSPSWLSAPCDSMLVGSSNNPSGDDAIFRPGDLRRVGFNYSVAVRHLRLFRGMPSPRVQKRQSPCPDSGLVAPTCRWPRNRFADDAAKIE